MTDVTVQEQVLDFTPSSDVLPVIYESTMESESPQLDPQPETETPDQPDSDPELLEINFIPLAEINPATPTVYEPVIMDATLSPVFTNVYTTLTTLAHGMNITPGNWILLLNKAMHLVSQIKELTKDEKIELSVELVIRYLDDNTDIADNILMTIKSSVYSMCTAILDNAGTLPNKPVPKPKFANTDPDLLATPQQIMDLLIKKVITIIKVNGNDLAKFKQAIPEIVLTLIAILDKFKHLSGMEKKNLLITTFQKLIRDEAPGLFNLSTEQQGQLNAILSSLPFVIDTLVNVARGKPAFAFNFDDILPAGTSTKIKKALFRLLTCGCFKSGLK